MLTCIWVHFPNTETATFLQPLWLRPTDRQDINREQQTEVKNGWQAKDTCARPITSLPYIWSIHLTGRSGFILIVFKFSFFSICSCGIATVTAFLTPSVLFSMHSNRSYFNNHNTSTQSDFTFYWGSLILNRSNSKNY